MEITLPTAPDVNTYWLLTICYKYRQQTGIENLAWKFSALSEAENKHEEHTNKTKKKRQSPVSLIQL